MRLLANLTISFNQGLMFHHGEINRLPTIVVFLVTTKRCGYYVVCGGNGMKEAPVRRHLYNASVCGSIKNQTRFRISFIRGVFELK